MPIASSTSESVLTPITMGAAAAALVFAVGIMVAGFALRGYLKGKTTAEHEVRTVELGVLSNLTKVDVENQEKNAGCCAEESKQNN
jgi:hypothetical protein